MIMMSEQVVPSAVAQSITAKFLTNEDVKPADLEYSSAMKRSQGRSCIIRK
jgi:hypothetical protein